MAPNPGPSKIVDWEPVLGWGRTRPLAIPNSAKVQVGVRVHTAQWRGIVSALASAWPVFPEVTHRDPGPGGGGIFPLGELLSLAL